MVLELAIKEHKETIAVAVAQAGGGEVRYVSEISNTPTALRKLAKQLGRGGARLSFCYEAGGCGYGTRIRDRREIGTADRVRGATGHILGLTKPDIDRPDNHVHHVLHNVALSEELR